MIRAIILATVALTLAGCQTPGVRRELVPVMVEATFYDPNLCAWPKVGDYIVQSTDLEAARYDLAGYQAYRCERDARLAAGRRQAEIAEGLKDR